MTKEYAKGYNAGKRRLRLDDERHETACLKEDFERCVFLAILPELVSKPWRTGDKTWSSMKEFIDGAYDFARLASRKFQFPVSRSQVAQAIEARRAATTGAVHESALPEECAQSEPSS